MIYHLSGHAAIDTYVLTRDETSLVRAEKEHHIGDVHWVAHKVVTLLFVDYANSSSKFLEFFCYTSSDALCTTCDDYYFIFDRLYLQIGIYLSKTTSKV